MPIMLVALTVLLAVVMCAVVGRKLEHMFGQVGEKLRTIDCIELWSLRVAGIWLVTCLLLPIVSAAQSDDLGHTNAQQILLSNQRLETIEARVAAVESLRLDARLALLEDTRDEVRTMRQWMLGIVSGVAIMIITQILTVLNRPKARQRRHEDEEE